MYWFAWTVVITAYVAVSLFAAYMTYREHQRNGQRSLVMGTLSYLLCLVWPLAAAGMYAFARWRPAEFVPADKD
jgi:membrane-bound metal-dependent hydrolase YbcI (DUF457 family)